MIIENARRNDNAERIDIENDWRSDLTRMLKLCKHRFFLYSDSLPAHLFDFPELTEQLSRIARANSRNQVHILLKDSDALIKKPNKLKQLCKRMPDRIKVKAFKQNQADFSTLIIADNFACLLQENEHLPYAYLSWHDAVLNRSCEEQFMRLWQQGSSINELRRF